LPARRQPLALSLAFVVVASAPSRAERPLETEDAVPLEPGQVQAEVSANYGHGPGGTNVGAFLGVLTVGLLPSLDLAAQGAVLALDEPRRTTHGGVGDTIVKVSGQGPRAERLRCDADHR
jgi:hypothetical protein